MFEAAQTLAWLDLYRIQSLESRDEIFRMVRLLAAEFQRDIVKKREAAERAAKQMHGKKGATPRRGGRGGRR